jgi:hypothetical protein
MTKASWRILWILSEIKGLKGKTSMTTTATRHFYFDFIFLSTLPCCLSLTGLWASGKNFASQSASSILLRTSVMFSSVAAKTALPSINRHQILNTFSTMCDVLSSQLIKFCPKETVNIVKILENQAYEVILSG